MRSFAVASNGDAKAMQQNLAILITSQDNILLTRQKDWPGGQFSLCRGTWGQQLSEDTLQSALQNLSGISVDVATIQRQNGTGSPCFRVSALQGNTKSSAKGLDLLEDKARSCARDVGVNPHEVEAVLGHVPPQVDVSRGPLEAAHWFNSRWLAALLQGEVECSSFSFFSGEHGSDRQTVEKYLQQSKSGSQIDDVLDVVLETGVFKYVLLVVTDEEKGQSKLIVRGDQRSGYHMDIYEKTARELPGLHVAEPLGGGRISHDRDEETIHIYGYSSAYGQAPHDLSAAIVRQWFPLYPPGNITVSYEGY